MVIGAKGRSGSGAAELFKSVGLTPTCWDVEETKKGGPFVEILEHDLLVNCVFLNKKIPPFIDHETLKKNGQLQVVSDVSCDPTGDYNPIPIYDSITTFDQPVHEIDSGNGPVLLQSIDHLPSMLPRESSEEFSKDLTPHLIDYFNGGSIVWDNALSVFNEHQQKL
jgi:alanine dehydrogenase